MPPSFEIAEPSFGAVVEICPGLLWTRIPIPMKVGHVNVYLLADGDGWAIVDTGYNDERSRATWRTLLEGPLKGQRITKVIVTHAHPDHIGAAGWLCQTQSAPLYMSQIEYLTCQIDCLDPGRYRRTGYQSFLRGHGVDEGVALAIADHLGAYADGLSGLPDTFTDLIAGDHLTVGDRALKIVYGTGHSPAQAMLYCAKERWLICADQLLGKLHPLLVLPPTQPDGNSYGLLLRSIDEMAADLDPNSLVLPGHFTPFFGLRHGLDSLLQHHAERCDRLVEACRNAPCSAAELAPVIFTDRLNPRQMNHAICEIVPYVNWLVQQGRMRWIAPGADGVRRLSSTSTPRAPSPV